MTVRALWLFTAAIAATIPAHLANAQGVPDSIVAEGVPEVPRDLVRSLARYQNTRSALFQGWFADRREVLITTRFAETNQVHHVAFPGGARTQWTFLNDRVLDAIPRPGCALFLYSTDEGGAENYQIYLHDSARGALTRISNGRSRNTAPVWSRSGRRLAWSNNSRNGKDMDLHVVDPSDVRSVRRFKEVSGDWNVTDWSPDERRVVAIEWISINETYVHLIDVETGAVETVTPRGAGEGPSVAYGAAQWSKDGRALYWLTDLDSEFRRLARHDLVSGKSETLSAAIPWNVDAFDLADDGETIALVANEDGISRLHLLRAHNDRKLELAEVGQDRELAEPKLPAGQISGLKFRKGTRELAFTLTAARATGDVYSFDVAQGRLERWTTSETGGLDAERFAEPELIHYPTFDGRSVPAFVYRPGRAFAGPRPVLIDIHGGPESQYKPGFLGRANFLIDELGITLVFPNVRGSAGYGKSYLKLDNGRKREDSVKDIGALLDWIARQPDLDRRRVAVVGGSYGGYMSLATLTHFGDRLKAGIDVVGVSNFVSLLENTQEYRRDLRRAEYGDERDPEMRKFLESISPLTSAERIRVPLLVAHGRNDPRVPASESARIVERVRQNGKPVWYVVAKDEGHGFAKKKNQDYLQAVEVLFLRQYLLGDGS